MERTVPECVLPGNRHDLTANATRYLCPLFGAGKSHIEPGSLRENPFVEISNGTIRNEWVAVEILDTLTNA